MKKNGFHFWLVSTFEKHDSWGTKSAWAKGKQDSILGKLTTTGQRTCMPGWCNFFWNLMFMRESRYAPVIRGCTCLSYHLKSLHYMAGKIIQRQLKTCREQAKDSKNRVEKRTTSKTHKLSQGCSWLWQFYGWERSVFDN